MRKRSSDEIWNYQQVSIGLNYRITDIAASLGLSQMKKLDTFVNLSPDNFTRLLTSSSIETM